jgi:nucleotide-binding universal stress UspA family protein
LTPYRTVLVGTDGSDSSLLAVDRAASIVAAGGGQLVIACAYFPATPRDVERASDALRDEAYQVMGSNPAEDSLQTAHDRAKAAGAEDIVTRVVGNRGLNSLKGRLLGSVPSDVAHKAVCDVLIVHTVQSWLTPTRLSPSRAR